jgi:hypothetical protein
MTWPVRIRVYPERGSTLHARVLIWPTKKAMLEHRRKAWGLKDRCEAFPQVGEWRRGKGLKRAAAQLAEVNFSARHLHVEAITHELAHVAFEWARRTGTLPTSLDRDQHTEREERYCTALGFMTNTFMCRAMDAGLLQ